tara:strand:- start:281 stop:757 length:477 start_codon:yes stop_codon:yes gene_type:complete
MKKRIGPPASQEAGFTLLEVLISMVIIVIGIAAVFGFVSVSDDVMQNAKHRERLDMVVTDVIETVHSDKENIAEYSGKELKSCSSLKTSQGKAKQLSHLKNWCNNLSSSVGDLKGADARGIKQFQKTDLGKSVTVVEIELTSKDGKNMIFAKRVFNAP